MNRKCLGKTYEKILITTSLEGLWLFTHSVGSDSLRTCRLQNAGVPCHSPPPRACSNSCPLSWWCHPTISSSVIPFSSCLLSFPASGSFPVSQLFPSGGWSIGASVSASVLPVNIQGWFPLGLTGLNSLLSKWLLRVPFWLWLLFQLAAAFSAALSYLGLSLLQGLLTNGFSSFLLFSGISPLLPTLWVALSLFVWHPHSPDWRISLDWLDTTQDGPPLLGRAMPGHFNATCHPWVAAQMAWHLFLARSFAARVMGIWIK